MHAGLVAIVGIGYRVWDIRTIPGESDPGGS
jgi:hypothetical protein